VSQKVQLSVLCGGQSTEHEVSIRSARNVVAALDPKKYDAMVIGIDHQGGWHRIENTKEFLVATDAHLKSLTTEPITVMMGERKTPWLSLRTPGQRYAVDCVFPVLHGTNGEDGTLQGLLDLLNLPYVGSDTQSSAICMEKDIIKQLLRAAHLPTADWHTLCASDDRHGLYQKLAATFGAKMFIKPVSLGSSVGVTPVSDANQFEQAVTAAFRLDDRLIVEPRLYGREIECAVLGNESPRASLPGEIVPHHDFYSYEAKYLDPNGASTEAPAKLSPEMTVQIQQTAIAAFKAAYCAGMARVDFFLVDDKKIYINEINTIPGFTNISMYPKMWQVSGLSYRELLDQLIQLAMARHQKQQSLIRVYQQ
jgi:D-alanine-D-alanine ligase